MNSFGGLRRANRRIKEICDGIKRFNTNVNYLNELASECQDLELRWSKQYARLNREYFPAIKRREMLIGQLELAKAHPHTFITLISLELNVMSDRDIIRAISESEEEIRSNRGSDTLVIVDLDVLLNNPEQSRKSVRQVCMKSHTVRLVNDDALDKISYGSWSLKSAESKLAVLELTYQDISTKKRLVGSCTCELTIALKLLQKKLDVVQEILRHPPHILYREFELELIPLRMRCFQQCLARRRAGTNTIRSANVRSSLDCMRTESHDTYWSTASCSTSVATNATTVSGESTFKASSTAGDIYDDATQWI